MSKKKIKVKIINDFIASKKTLNAKIFKRNENVEKNDEMRCDSNSETRLDRIKFHEHSLEMFRKS